MKNIFTKHPRSIGETYWQHLWMASCFGVQMTLGGIACLIHAIFPFLFVRTASNVLHKLWANYRSRNNPLSEVGDVVDIRNKS